MAATIPNCKSYDPTFAYEMSAIIEDGLKECIKNKKICFTM